MNAERLIELVTEHLKGELATDEFQSRVDLGLSHLDEKTRDRWIEEIESDLLFIDDLRDEPQITLRQYYGGSVANWENEFDRLLAETERAIRATAEMATS